MRKTTKKKSKKLKNKPTKSGKCHYGFCNFGLEPETCDIKFEIYWASNRKPHDLKVRNVVIDAWPVEYVSAGPRWKDRYLRFSRNHGITGETVYGDIAKTQRPKYPALCQVKCQKLKTTTATTNTTTSTTTMTMTTVTTITITIGIYNKFIAVQCL